jgi:hypothetical protein
MGFKRRTGEGFLYPWYCRSVGCRGVAKKSHRAVLASVLRRRGLLDERRIKEMSLYIFEVLAGVLWDPLGRGHASLWSEYASVRRS